MKAVIEWALLPPGNLLVLGLLGVLLWRRRLGRGLALAALLLLIVLSSPYLAWPLIEAAQWPEPPPTPEQLRAAKAQAIVVLGAGTLRDIPDYGDTVNSNSLVRLRHAARVQRWTQLPLVVSGGSPRGTSVGELMARILREEVGVPVALVDDKSLNTYENALYSWRLLQPRGLTRIILVTEAMHMPRAVEVFRQMGFEVVPAATHYVAPMISFYAFTPRLETLNRSWLALHELIGRCWYRLRYAPAAATPAAP